MNLPKHRSLPRNTLAASALAALAVTLVACQSAPASRVTSARTAPSPVPRLSQAEAQSALDRQQAELIGALKNSGVSLVRSAGRLRLTLPVWRLFGADALELKPDAESVAPLPQLRALLQAWPGARLQIRVFTDSIGGAVVNQALSLRRGDALLAAFNADGIDASRLSVLAVGDSSPVAGNDTPEGRRQNRRIELTVLPQ